MEFPIVNATIKLSPIKKEKTKKTGSRFVVKEVKSANQPKNPPLKACSRVVEVSVPREALKNRTRPHNEQQCNGSSSVPLIEVNINKVGFQVRRGGCLKYVIRSFPINAWNFPGGVLGLIFARYARLSSRSPYDIIVYSVASYRPHLSHFWENM